MNETKVTISKSKLREIMEKVDMALLILKGKKNMNANKEAKK